MAVLTLRLLGGCELSRDGIPVSPGPGRKLQALLSYLALSGGVHSREHLATLLWGDRQDEQARQSLRQAISALRKMLGDAGSRILISSGDGIRCDTSAIRIDAVEFERLASEAGPEQLKKAIELFRGDLLASIGAVCEAFDDWLAGERLRYRNLAADALERFARHAGDRITAPEIAGFATHLIKLDPLCEPAHGALMRHYHGRGQRALAMRQYQQFAALLQRELGLDPAPETRQIFEHIQTAPPAPSAHGPDAAAGGGTRTWKGPARPAILAAAGVLALGISAVIYFAASPSSKPAVPENQVAAPGQAETASIAVLPFRTASEDDRARTFAFGLRHGILTALSMISDLSVLADRPAAADGVQEADAPVGRPPAGYVLEGSVQLAQRSVRITATLTDAAEERTLWTQLYHRKADDIFSLQNDIILSVVTALQVELTEGEQARISLVAGTDNLEAWLLAGQALQEVRRLTPERIVRAKAFYEQALKLDPDYTGAKGGLAWTYLIKLLLGWRNEIDSSLEAASRLGTDLAGNESSKAGGYGILSWVELFRGNHEKAIMLGERAVEANLAGADYIAQFAFVLTFAGRPERAISLMNRAMRLSPSPPDWFHWNLARAHRLAGQPERALAILRSAETEPVSPLYLVELTAALAAAGRQTEARQAARRILDLKPDFSVRKWMQLPPYRNPALAQRESALLTGAGLPE
ncbi:MAG: BTAD domain-containing putative transcriptional regulator [Alphaproteobacteria bacterium]